MGKVKCLQCNKILESKSRHDFAQCSCSNKTFVDGGNDYMRAGGVDMDKIEVIEDKGKKVKVSAKFPTPTKPELTSIGIIAIDLALKNTGVAYFKDGLLVPDQVYIITDERKPRAGEKNFIYLPCKPEPKASKKDWEYASRQMNDRLVVIRDQVMALVELLSHQACATIVVMEGPSFGSRGDSLFDIGMLTGMVRDDLRKEGFELRVIPPTVVKKVVAKAGNAPKSMIAMNIYKLYKLDLSAHGKVAEDMYDAIAVGHTYLKMGGLSNKHVR